MQYTARKPLLRVWPQPGKEPLGDVDRAILITIHHQAAVLIGTAIRPHPQRHVLFVLADMTHLRRIAFINHRQFFPVEQTLIFKHLYKAVETPIIIHRAIAETPLLALLGRLLLLLVFLPDYLPLGKIAMTTALSASLPAMR